MATAGDRPAAAHRPSELKFDDAAVFGGMLQRAHACSLAAEADAGLWAQTLAQRGSGLKRRARAPS